MLRSPGLRPLAALGLAVGVAAFPVRVSGQSLTSGSIRGAILSTNRDFLPAVEVTLERSDGRAIMIVETARNGSFIMPLVQPGTYRILVEEVGYQPVRYLDVPVAAGQTTVVNAVLERRPPPILDVTEVPFSGALGGMSIGSTVDGAELRTMDLRLEGSDVSRQVTEVDAPRDGRNGFVGSGGGLAASESRLFVDGLPETFMRHPGAPAEPAETPAFAREGLAQAQVIGIGFDTEWRGYPGPVLAAHTQRGANTFAFRPYGFVSSAALGGRAEDNPADSTASSFQVGASISGAVVPDTAHYYFRIDFQRLRTPSAYPWENDTASFNGGQTSLRQAILDIGADQYGQQLNSAVSPVVRDWRQLGAMGRVDWQIGDNQVVARAAYSRWEEEQPLLGAELSNLAGALLEANDVSAGLSVTSGTPTIANEFRLGFTSTVRDWKGEDLLPSTVLAGEGVAFGGSAGLPGKFTRRAVDVSDAFQIALGRHRVKAGGLLSMADNQYEYLYGSSGVFTFGNLDGFEDGQGTFFQTVTAGDGIADTRLTDWGLFLQDNWSVVPDIQLSLGIRYDQQVSPDDALQANPDWEEASGVSTGYIPKDTRAWQPRVGFLWDVQNRGEWIVAGGGGLYRGRIDHTALAEVVLSSGGAIEARRGIGDFALWPNLPDEQLAPRVGPRITFFNNTYRTPSGFKAGLSLSRVFQNGLALRVAANYYHTDYLLVREDLNRVDQPLAETQEGRPVYGDLVKLGAMVTPEPTSNRRFSDFDMVSGLSPTGFSDHREATVSLERQVRQGISFNLAYTFSQTEDNVLGKRSLDPADQLNPFPDGLAGADWADGRSDFDVPHRFMAFAQYRSAGQLPIAVGARFRYRSGLPFTPGFRPGVDINGDGSGNNDPAYVDAAVDGLSTLLASATCDAAPVNSFVERNSCREEAASALDLRFELGLPARFSDGGRLVLVLDAFNVVATETGVVDRALTLVNPNAQLQQGGSTVTVPLIANPNFGQLQVRRAEPRSVRLGVRVEY